jgi:predicted enzyme related to lactoylglutathione lyase
MFPPPITGPGPKGAVTINANPFDDVVDFYRAVCAVVKIPENKSSFEPTASTPINFGDTLFIHSDPSDLDEKRVTANIDVVFYTSASEDVDSAWRAGCDRGGKSLEEPHDISTAGGTRRLARMSDPDRNIVWLVHDEQT